MVERLEDLPAAESLYEYRAGADAGVPLWLPHNQGDVFDNVDLKLLTGKEDIGLAMLFLHPCTMRRSGGALVDRATVLHVRQKSARKAMDDPNRWNNAYSVIPLPDFSATYSDAYEADLMAMGTVPSGALTRATRVATFSEEGRSHMLHRIIFHLTRKAIPTGVITQSTERVQQEIELQCEWTMAAASRHGELDEQQIIAVEAEFQSALNAAWPGGQNDDDKLRYALHSEDDDLREEAVRNIRVRCESDEPGRCIS